jgi:hypothetical protein
MVDDPEGGAPGRRRRRQTPMINKACCPACAGRRFKFPADLADSQGRMCQAHHKEADTVIQQRMARAEASNPAGWRMTTDAQAWQSKLSPM